MACLRIVIVDVDDEVNGLVDARAVTAGISAVIETVMLYLVAAAPRVRTVMCIRRRIRVGALGGRADLLAVVSGRLQVCAAPYVLPARFERPA
jgi:hypothetical protein